MPHIETKSSGDQDPSDPVSPMPLMSREEFERRYKAVQREESRYALIMISILFAVLLALLFFTLSSKAQMPTWLNIALILMMFAIFVVPVRLAMKYFDLRPQRFGFVCPNCNKPLRGFLVFRSFKYAECPNCHTWLAVE